MMHRMSRGFGLIEVSLGIAVGSAALVGAVMTFSHVRSGSVARDAYQSAVMIRSSVMNAMMGGQGVSALPGQRTGAMLRLDPALFNDAQLIGPGVSAWIDMNDPGTLEIRVENPPTRDCRRLARRITSVSSGLVGSGCMEDAPDTLIMRVAIDRRDGGIELASVTDAGGWILPPPGAQPPGPVPTGGGSGGTQPPAPPPEGPTTPQAGAGGSDPAPQAPPQGEPPAASGSNPPAEAWVPPGHGGTPPGQGGSPPSHGGAPPGQGGVPPGQSVVQTPTTPSAPVQPQQPGAGSAPGQGDGRSTRPENPWIPGHFGEPDFVISNVEPGGWGTSPGWNSTLTSNWIGLSTFNIRAGQGFMIAGTGNPTIQASNGQRASTGTFGSGGFNLMVDTPRCGETHTVYMQLDDGRVGRWDIRPRPQWPSNWGPAPAGC